MTGRTKRANELRYVLFKEEGAWVATCLEHYIGAQGNSREDAETGLKIVYRAELDYSLQRTGKPFDGIMPAPERFHEMWESDRVDVVKSTIYDKSDEAVEALAA